MKLNLGDWKNMRIKKKYKRISLKIVSEEESKVENPEEDENFTLLVKRLGKFFNNDKSLNFSRNKKLFKKKEAYTSTQNVTFYECENQGHIKNDCPKLTKKSGFKGRKE